MKIYTLKILFLALLTYPFFSFAREGIPQDFSFYANKAEVDINIEKDGSFEDVTTESFVITKQEAKEYFGPFKISFDPTHEDVSVLEAYVINDGNKILVDKNNIYRSSAAARKDGLVDSSELAIPYSQVKVGSIVYFKILTKNKAGPFGDYFNFKNLYGVSAPTNEDIVKIKSPKELFFSTYDPNKVLSVVTKRDSGGNYILESRLKRAYSHVAVGEIGKISRENTTALMVTNVENWNKFRQMVLEKFVSVQLKESIPSALQDVINKIPKNDSFENKLNKSLIYITSNYDYLGDWRGDGKVIPKSVNRIVADRFGDCKDFSTLLINLLRGMNIKADYALVNRSFELQEIPEQFVPMMDFFNHMIVRVENEGKVYWIDPTNRYSVGVSIRADISGRKALVLGETKTPLELIPDIDRSKQSETLVKLYQFDSVDSATVDVLLKNQGEASKLIQDAFKGKSDSERQALLMKIIIKDERSAVLSFKQNDKRDFEYSELNIKAKYRANQLMIKEKGKEKEKDKSFLSLPEIPFLNTFLYLRQDGIGELDIRLMSNIDNVYFYKNIFLKGNFPKTCQIKTNWVEASRVLELRNEGVVVRDRIEYKKLKLTSKDYAK